MNPNRATQIKTPVLQRKGYESVCRGTEKAECKKSASKDTAPVMLGGVFDFPFHLNFIKCISFEDVKT